MKKLIICGTGIQYLTHLTHEAKLHISTSEIVLYLLNDPMTKKWIVENSQQSEDLDILYRSSNMRIDAYKAIENYIIATLEKYEHVCVALYGHPCICAMPALAASEWAVKNNIFVKILPGISADACLFSDLLINPLKYGLQSYEATDFIKSNRNFDLTSNLLLWQVSNILTSEHYKEVNYAGLELLKSKLLKKYRKNKTIIVYEASLYSHFESKIQEIELNKLLAAEFSALSSIFIPASMG